MFKDPEMEAKSFFETIVESINNPSDVRCVVRDFTRAFCRENLFELAQAYVAAGIVSQRFVDDATHVAAATVARADAIVSWNFRHIVRVDKMRAYNQVNLQAGFGLLSIVSPQEVRFDDD